MQTLPARVVSHMHDAARELTPRLQDHAATRGVSGELVGHLRVHYNGAGFTAAVSDPRHQQAFDDHEWGSETQPPTGFARTFESELNQAWHTAFGAALQAHLSRAR